MRSRVRPGGVVVIADEAPPETAGARTWWRLKRAPLVALTWLLTQTTTRAVGGLPELLERAGFAAAAIAVTWKVGLLAAALVLVQVFAILALLPRLPLAGSTRWLTYGGAATAGSGAAVAGLLSAGVAAGGAYITVVAVGCVAMAILSVDLAGTTPWYPSTINSLGNNVELADDRCTGVATCVQVCPRDVLHMNGKRRKVEPSHPDDCIRCGACIVQCPEEALRFRFEDGRVVEAETVRRTRLNMLGRRRVAL